MSIISSHDIFLYGGNQNDIVLRPLCDDDLPLLCRWNADPEVVYWSDTGNAETFREEEIRSMYAAISANALCFLAEVDGRPIGDFSIQSMNIPKISAQYPQMDVRRIEATIGEKTMWGQGIGTAIPGMLIDYAFYGEHADILYGITADYNIRSQKMFLKQGFHLTAEEEVGEDSLRAKKESYYMLTRRQFAERKRGSTMPKDCFDIPLCDLQPTQLYISKGKLRLIQEWFRPEDRTNFDPLPVFRLDDKILMLDGHTRAVAACLAGWNTIPVYWDTEEFDVRPYVVDVRWCAAEGIRTPADLTGRIVSHKDYERLWRRRCMEMALE